MGNPYNHEAKKGFFWMANPKCQLYLDTEIDKFLKLHGRKLIMNPDHNLHEELAHSPIFSTPKKQKLMKSSTPKTGRVTESSVWHHRATDYSKRKQSQARCYSLINFVNLNCVFLILDCLSTEYKWLGTAKQEIAKAAIEKLSGLVTESSPASVQFFHPQTQSPNGVYSNGAIAAATLNPFQLPQELLQQLIVEKSGMRFPEPAVQLSDARTVSHVQAQAKKYKCDPQEHTHHSSLPRCLLPLQTHAKYISHGTMNGKVAPCSVLPPVTQVPLAFQPQDKEQNLPQQSELPSATLQSPPMVKLLSSVQQMRPTQLSSQSLQHQKPLVPVVGRRLQRLQQQSLLNYSLSLLPHKTSSLSGCQSTGVCNIESEGSPFPPSQKGLHYHQPFNEVSE